MQPDEQWEFRIIVYPSDSKLFGPYSACLQSGDSSDLADTVERMTGHGATPALAIADLFQQAHNHLSRRGIA